MATFKDIEKANGTIKTMKITRWDKKSGREISKDYAEVNQRIKAFRMIYPEGFIRTSIISHADGVVVMRTEAGYIDESGNDRVLGTGMAFEDKKNGMINGTSYIENCETSSVGRALGMIGLGIDMSIASYEEVNNAIAQQESIKNNLPTREPEIICEKCGNVITDKGRASAKKIAEQSKLQFGKCMCWNCAHETKEEMKQIQEQKNQESGNEPQLPFPIDEM